MAIIYDPFGTSGSGKDPLIFVSTEFAEGTQDQAWFDDLAASGIDGIFIALQNGTSIYSEAENNIIKAHSAGLIVGVYARPIEKLLSAYNALASTTKDMISVVVPDVEVEPSSLLTAQKDVVRANCPSSATTTTSITNPPTPSTITVTPDGTAANVLAATITINGTNYSGGAQSDSVTFTAGALTRKETTKLFATVTSIVTGSLGTGIVADVGIGAYRTITHAYLTSLEALGKITMIYAGWGGWFDIMGIETTGSYADNSQGDPWASAHPNVYVFQRDLYTVAATSPNEHPTAMEVPYTGFTFESWPLGRKIGDWATRDAVQWADGDTWGGTDFDLGGVTCTFNVVSASSLGLSGQVVPHEHEDSTSGGSVLRPETLAVTGTASLSYSSGSKHFFFGTVDATHTTGTEGLDITFDFATATATIETAKYGTGYRHLVLTALDITFNAGASGTGAELVLDSTNATFKTNIKSSYTSGTKSLLLGTIDTAHTSTTEGLEIKFDFATGTATIETAKYGTNYRNLVITALDITLNGGSSGTFGQVKIDDTTANIMKIRPRGDTNYTSLQRTADTAGTLTIPVTGTVTVEGHDNTSHANRTRQLVIAPGVFTSRLGAPDLAVRGTNLRYEAWAFDATSAESIIATTTMPSDYVSGAITLKFWWTNLGAGSGNVVWITGMGSVASADNMNNEAPTTATQTIAAPAQDVLTISTSTLSFTPTAGEVLMVRIQRSATDGADTLNANDAGVLGMAIEYTADM